MRAIVRVVICQMIDNLQSGQEAGNYAILKIKGGSFPPGIHLCMESEESLAKAFFPMI